MNAWTNAWIFSAICVAWTYNCLTSAAIRKTDALTLASATFFAPLLILIGGSNSFIYVLDIIGPILVLRAWKASAEAPIIRRIAGFLAFSIGVLPFAETLLFAPDRERLLMAAINCYRTVVDVSLFALAATLKFNRTQSRNLPAATVNAIVGTCFVLCAAVILQYLDALNTNIFYSWESDQFVSGREGILRARLGVLGLFRGSLGLLAGLGFAAFLATTPNQGRTHLGATAAAGTCFVIAVLVGSKTTLLTIAMVLVYRTGTSTALTVKKLLALAGVVTAILALTWVKPDLIPATHIQRMHNAFTGNMSKKMDTVKGRLDKWNVAHAGIEHNPLILAAAGVQPSHYKGHNITLSFYHNEYLSVAMHGGIVSLAFYFMGLHQLYLQMWRSQSGTLRRFGTTTFIMGLIQGVSVNHLMPGLLFGHTTAVLFLIYGLASNNTVRIAPPCGGARSGLPYGEQ